MPKTARKPVQQAPQRQPKLFVYTRFSSAKQADGDSLRRQMAYARRWADENGYVVDESLTMADAGLSAFTGDHVRRGALGIFLAAIREKGFVQPNDVLLIESLDRLSRREPVDAQRQFSDIIDSGVMIVTANDGQRYSRELLRENPSPLFLALATMIRSHEESATKSKRITAAARAQCERWIAGDHSGYVSVGRDPFWVRRISGSRRFELVPEAVRVVRALIKHFRAGVSPHRALEMIAESGMTVPPGLSNAGRAYATIGSRVLLGERTVAVDGTDYTLAGYYPAVATELQFAELEHLRAARGRRGGKSAVVPLFTGARISFCGTCGSAVASQNVMGRSRQADGRPQDGHRRAVCTGSTAVPRCPAGSISIVPVERALLAYCSDQYALDSLVQGQDVSGPVAGRLARAREAVAKLEREISNLNHAIAEAAGQGLTLQSVIASIAQREDQLAIERKKVAAFDSELAVVRQMPLPASADAWVKLTAGVHALDPDARRDARRLVLDTFQRIEIHMHGFHPVAEGETPSIGLVLVSKAGVSRRLEIDRRSGEFLSGTEAERKAVQAARAKLRPAKAAA
ncbi:recombinase family protein [Paraburkholderia sp. BR13444]|uniref:recombinase family protein n=1 Tax=Paraburkholderia sp. BR13444 TaxID=3236997 RepID=UPI0034CF1C7D